MKARPAWRTQHHARRATVGLAQPAAQLLGHELIVAAVRVRGPHPLDLGELTGGQVLGRVEAPPAGEQALAAQYLVDARYAAPRQQYRLLVEKLG